MADEHEHAHKDASSHGHAHDGGCCDDDSHDHSHKEGAGGHKKDHADGCDDDCGHDHGHADAHAHGHSDGHDHDHHDGDDDEEDKPLPPISWMAVSMIYLGGSVVCGAFALAHFVFELETVKGFYLIFAFFPLCLVYSLFKWHLQRGEEAAALVAKKKTE